MGLDLNSIKFVQARWFTSPRRNAITMIVIHDMEAGEYSTTAESCANYFKNTTVKASAHYNCDNDSIVCSVKPHNVAYHTGHGGTNNCSIGIEQAGYAHQSADDWNDPYSRSMIFNQVAPLVAAISETYDVPLTFLRAADLRAGNWKGVTTHWEISKAFVPGGHTDPGSNYPMQAMLNAAQDLLAPPVPAPAPNPGPTPAPHPIDSSEDEDMVRLVEKDGRISLFTINGTTKRVMTCWQEPHRGNQFSDWQDLVPGSPITASSIAGEVLGDGRLSIIASTRPYGVLMRSMQPAPGAGPWTTWVGENDLIRFYASLNK